MGYYVRAFCTSAAVPPLDQVLEELRVGGYEVSVEANDAPLDSGEWVQCELVYNSSLQPLIVDCNRDTGQDSLCKAECEEFISEVLELPASSDRERVIQHLRKTRFIVVSQLLLDIDDRGSEIAFEFLGFFVSHCGGLIYADLEGFYEGSKVFLPME